MEESEQGMETMCSLNEGGKDMCRRFEILVLWACECVCECVHVSLCVCGVCVCVCVHAHVRAGVSPE